ncbi:DUF3592 domain-containing protein [Kibdelosporangium philippinense]|uniref:DUF3592 domain-containing protein n=1 Tax=Kibdelosporangium philippinense TaxID=211113 RepID=A0ABS8Z7I9_9PSEU|nr:DUF3592 domain-containing protein [Kibdelosporangium philippinense]MCE7002538.1 DUF3592 domain-containing protein [Kibdelosporangium philippinense]
MAEIDDVRRLRLRTVWGMDDLTELTHHRAGPDLATAAVRRLRLRSRLFTVTGLLLLIGFSLGAALIEREANELLPGWWRVDGTVVDTGPGFIDVRCVVDGVEQVVPAKLTGSSPNYEIGDPVTLVYDPDAPRYQADDPPNASFLTAATMISSLVGGVFLLSGGLIAGGRWNRRMRSVRKQGWRSGRALVRQRLRGRIVLTIKFPDGDVLTAVTVRPVILPLPMGLTASDVYVGGQGSALSIMFLTGPFVVAAKPVSE